MAIQEPQIDLDDELFVEDDEQLAEDYPEAPAAHGTTIQAGWGAMDKAKPKSDYPVDFKPSESAQLVKFLEDLPFAVYDQHWIDRSEGKRSFVCLADSPEGCPLCSIAGDRPRQKVAFNVLLLSDGAPTVQILTAPVTLARILRDFADDPKTGPLSKHYWTIRRIGTGRETQYVVQRIRSTELAEDWDLDPQAVSTEAANAARYSTKAISVSPREELLTLARQIVSQ